MATEAELAAYYPEDYNPYADWQAPSGLLAALSRAIRNFITRRAISSLPLSAIADEKGQAMDVGCGRGDLGALLISRGWSVTGVEPSADAAASAAEKGLETKVGTLGSVDLAGRQFDAITFQHSLEHVTDPAADLALVSELLVPGGKLLVSVPNFGSLQRRVFNGRWFHLDLPRHRFHYTDAGLRALAEGAGLKVAATGSSSSPVGLPGSLSYVVFGRWVFNGPIVARVITLASLVIYPVALLMALPSGGEVLHMVATKPDPADG
ncbi:MAG: class I SAM-dependent methyltransferase [Solirubrobacterales bacterium]